MKIIGIGGTDASGKDSIGELLAERFGWKFISVTDLLREEARKRGMTLDRSILRQISAEWRREFGMSVLVDKAVAKYQAEGKEYSGLAIASLRHFAEADKVHELGGQVVWVDADLRVRYNRILARNRGTEDHKTFEQFAEEEQAQMHHSGDQNTVSLSSVKERADLFIENNGNDIEAFKNSVAQKLGLTN